jgi:hypothetical protein
MYSWSFHTLYGRWSIYSVQTINAYSNLVRYPEERDHSEDPDVAVRGSNMDINKTANTVFATRMAANFMGRDVSPKNRLNTYHTARRHFQDDSNLTRSETFAKRDRFIKCMYFYRIIEDKRNTFTVFIHRHQTMVR